jgi:hypothetical protein
MLERIQARRTGHRPGQPGPPEFTKEQLQLIRSVAIREAGRLKDLPNGQAGLLADAVVGVLAVPAVS